MAKHPGHIMQRGSSWRIRLHVGGEPHHFSIPRKTVAQPKGMTKSEAEQFAREKDAELRKRAAKGLPGPMAFSELLERFKEVKLPDLAESTRKTYGYSLDAFETYFVEDGGDPRAHEVRPGHVQSFLHWRRRRAPDGSKRRKPLSPRSLAKDRATLHAVFSFAETLEVVEANPVSKVDAPKSDGRDPVILTEDQFEQLLDECRDRPMLRTYVLLLGETGMRCESEALWLRWEDVDLEKGFLWVSSGRDGHRTKSGKGRWVPITPRLRRALQSHAAEYRMRLYDGERSPWVFHHPWSRRRAEAGARIGTLRRAFAAAAERAGLPEDLNQHDLRHRRVTTWLADGNNPVHVKEAVGHADLRTTMSYTHLAREHLKSLVEDDEARDELRELANA